MAQRGTRVYLSSGWLGRRSVRAVFPRSSQQAAGSLPPSGGAETESPADVNSLASGLVRSRLRRISGLVRHENELAVRRPAHICSCHIGQTPHT